MSLTQVVLANENPYDVIRKAYFGAVDEAGTEQDRRTQLARQRLQDFYVMMNQERQQKADQLAQNRFEEQQKKDAAAMDRQNLAGVAGVLGKAFYEGPDGSATYDPDVLKGLADTYGVPLDKATGIAEAYKPYFNRLFAANREQQAKEQKKAPETRNFVEGNNIVTRQWDGQTWQLVPGAVAPRVAPQNPSYSFIPGEVDENGNPVTIEHTSGSIRPLSGLKPADKQAGLDVKAAGEAFDKDLVSARQRLEQWKKMGSPPEMDPFAQAAPQVRQVVETGVTDPGILNQLKQNYIRDYLGRGSASTPPPVYAAPQATLPSQVTAPQTSAPNVQTQGAPPTSAPSAVPPVPGAVIRSMGGQRVWAVQLGGGKWGIVGNA